MRKDSPSPTANLKARIRQSCKVDVLVLLLVCLYSICPNHILPDCSFVTRCYNQIPRVALDSINLLVQGLAERCLVLPCLSWLDESGYTSAIRFPSKGGMLPDTAEERARLQREASTSHAPLLHNKNALIMTLAFLCPMEYAKGCFAKTATVMQPPPEIPSLKGLLASVLIGLIIIDLILGTAHLVSHRGVLKKQLWPYHARHHKKHRNYAAVKFFGEPFDLEVFLTQACYAFLPRALGLDVVTGMILINWFSFQLLLEHTGYSCLYVAGFHEAHHRYGNVAFYHFPLLECLFGRMPTAVQMDALLIGDQRVLKKISLSGKMS